MKKKLILITGIAALVLLIVVALIVLMPKVKAYIPYYKDLKGIDQEDRPYSLTIDKADFQNEVAARLQENGVIVSSVRFLGYIEEHYPNFVWYNGIYELNANMSYEELCKALMKPDTMLDYVKVTVPEGKNIAEIAQIIANSGLCTEEEFLEAADSYDYDFAFLDELKERNQKLIGYKLEGFLFPATYEFRADTVTARDIVHKMLNTFEEYISDDMIKQAKDLGLSFNDYVSFASVIQGEAPSIESMRDVAGVFWNRVHSKSFPRMESCPTKDYVDVLKTLDHYTEKMGNSYNTYICTGFPVGPINCPGVDALKALLDPTESDFYFFVTDINGKFYFNKTLSGHNSTIRSLDSQGLWQST